MTRRRDQPASPFSRTERAAIQALAWELAPAIPQIEGMADEATPGRLYPGPTGFIRRTGLAQVRSTNVRGQSGLFGSVHAVVQGLAQPVSFQFQLRRGRLVALIADAYGQDVSGIDWDKAPLDQLFYLDTHGRSHPIRPDLYRRRDRSRDGAETPPSRVQASVPTTPTVVVHRPAAVPAQTATAQVAPTSPKQAIAAGIDKTTLKAGIWVGLFTLAALIGILTDGGFIFPLIVAFWLARALTQPKSLDRIHQTLAARQAQQLG